MIQSNPSLFLTTRAAPEREVERQAVRAHHVAVPAAGHSCRSPLHDSCRWKWLKNDDGNPAAGAVRVSVPHLPTQPFHLWFLLSYVTAFKTCSKIPYKERLLSIPHAKGNYYTPPLSLQRWKS